MASYSVLTYIYGNKEWLHEPEHYNSNVDYICVTDDRTLKSKHWKIIYDPLKQFNSLRMKFSYVKLHPFHYVNTEHVVIIDGAVQPKTNLDPLVKTCGNQLLLKQHPSRTNLYDELIAWCNCRGLSEAAMTRYVMMASVFGAKLFAGPLYETCCMVWPNIPSVVKLGDCTFNIMLKLDEPNDPWLSNQLVLAMLLQTAFTNIKVKLLNQHDWFNRYGHSSTNLYNK